MQLAPASIERVVHIAAGATRLTGHLTLPAGATAIVICAHSRGSNRYSLRDRHVVMALHRSGLGTLLLDLLSSAEQAGEYREDVALLAERLAQATEWLSSQSALHGLRVGYFGAGADSAAALVAAARLGHRVRALVTRGGRPELTAPQLPDVTAATLLIVGGADHDVLELHERAYERLRCTKRLVVVPGASQLFDEPGALEEVSSLATDWFQRNLEAAVRA